MLTPMGKLAVKIVHRMHRLAGFILDRADTVESRITPKE